ncbi:MAG: hypothetical protein ACQCN6_09385 [Candidatus Bathyarchaeia archaeon]|jgi:hypothetical protein
MTGELEKQLREHVKDKETADNLQEIISAAGKEFPCLSCPSRNECGSFSWFIKWFGTDNEK